MNYPKAIFILLFCIKSFTGISQVETIYHENYGGTGYELFGDFESSTDSLIFYTRRAWYCCPSSGGGNIFYLGSNFKEKHFAFQYNNYDLGGNYAQSRLTYNVGPGEYIFWGDPGSISYKTINNEKKASTKFNSYARALKAAVVDSIIYFITGKAGTYWYAQEDSACLITYNKNQNKVTHEFCFNEPGRGLISDFEIDISNNQLITLRENSIYRWDLHSGSFIQSNPQKKNYYGDFFSTLKSPLPYYSTNFEFLSNKFKVYYNDSTAKPIDSIEIKTHTIYELSNTIKVSDSTIGIAITHYKYEYHLYQKTFLTNRFFEINFNTGEVINEKEIDFPWYENHIINKIKLDYWNNILLGGYCYPESPRMEAPKRVTESSFLAKLPLDDLQPFVSINELSTKQPDLLIYPNPASEYINILNSHLNSTFKIISMDGEVLFSGSLKNRVFVGGLPKGLYLFEVINETNVQKTIFVKN